MIAFIDEHRTEYGVEPICKQVPPAWPKRARSAHPGNPTAPVPSVPCSRNRFARAAFIAWAGTGQATAELTGQTPINLTRQANGQMVLALDYRLSRPPTAPVTLAIGCGPGCSGSLPITGLPRRAHPRRWQHPAIPLACFATSGANLRQVATPFSVRATGRLTLDVANIRLRSGTGAGTSCGRHRG